MNGCIIQGARLHNITSTYPPPPLISVAVIGFARSFYEIAEGSEGSVQVSLLLNGRQLQRTIAVMVFSMDGTAIGKYLSWGLRLYVLAIIFSILGCTPF